MRRGAGCDCTCKTAKKLGADQVKILKQSDSGDFSGDTNAGGRISFGCGVYKSGDVLNRRTEDSEQYISDDERALLLTIARESIRALCQRRGRFRSIILRRKGLLERGAAFVTITIDGRLRGCIGYTEAILPLYETVSRPALSRPPPRTRVSLPLTKSEYGKIKLEISVLTPLAENQ